MQNKGLKIGLYAIIIVGLMIASVLFAPSILAGVVLQQLDVDATDFVHGEIRQTLGTGLSGGITQVILKGEGVNFCVVGDPALGGGQPFTAIVISNVDTGAGLEGLMARELLPDGRCLYQRHDGFKWTDEPFILDPAINYGIVMAFPNLFLGWPPVHHVGISGSINPDSYPYGRAEFVWNWPTYEPFGVIADLYFIIGTDLLAPVEPPLPPPPPPALPPELVCETWDVICHLNNWVVRNLVNFSRFLFIPASASLERLGGLWYDVQGRVPIGYWALIRDSFGDIGTGTPAFSLPANVPLFNMLRSAFGLILWVGFGFWLVKRVSIMQV